jgi:hypothetical protein
MRNNPVKFQQGRVQVVMNPSKYEIPSGSTYGYFIADDADKVNLKVFKFG